MAWAALIPLVTRALGSLVAAEGGAVASGAARAVAGSAAKTTAAGAAEVAASQAAKTAATSGVEAAATNTAKNVAKDTATTAAEKVFTSATAPSGGNATPPEKTPPGGSPPAGGGGGKPPQPPGTPPAASPPPPGGNKPDSGSTGPTAADATKKAAEQIADSIKDRALGAAMSMGSSLVTNTLGTLVGGAMLKIRGNPEQGGIVSRAFAAGDAGPAGMRAAGMADRSLSRMAKTADPTGVGRGTFKMAKMAFDATPTGMMTSGAVKFGSAIKDVVQVTEAWGRELLQGQRHLSAFNGTIAKAFAEGDRREMIRNIESGQATGNSTALLSAAFQDLMDEVQPIKDGVTSIFNVTATVVTAGVTGMVRNLKAISNFCVWLQENMPWAKDEPAPEIKDNFTPFIELMHTIENRHQPRAPRR